MTEAKAPPAVRLKDLREGDLLAVTHQRGTQAKFRVIERCVLGMSWWTIRAIQEVSIPAILSDEWFYLSDLNREDVSWRVLAWSAQHAPRPDSAEGKAIARIEAAEHTPIAWLTVRHAEDPVNYPRLHAYALRQGLTKLPYDQWLALQHPRPQDITRAETDEDQ